MDGDPFTHHSNCGNWSIGTRTSRKLDNRLHIKWGCKKTDKLNCTKNSENQMQTRINAAAEVVFQSVVCHRLVLTVCGATDLTRIQEHNN